MNLVHNYCMLMFIVSDVCITVCTLQVTSEGRCHFHFGKSVNVAVCFGVCMRVWEGRGLLAAVFIKL